MPLRIITQISSTLQTRTALLPPPQATQMSQTFWTKFYISTFQQFKVLTFPFDVGYWSFVQGSFCRSYHILTFAKFREDVR